MRDRLAALARAVDIEGALVIIGTACLAYASNALHPLAPFAVVGAVSLTFGTAIAWASRPRRA